MHRSALVVGIVAAALVCASTDLSACGDKFLRGGRSPRFSKYAAIHPAAILIFAPQPSSKGIKELQDVLRKAGHKSRVVAPGTGLAEAFSAASYDVVFANYSDAARIRTELESVPSNPKVLPFLMSKPSEALKAAVMKEYHGVAIPEQMTPGEFLAQIDNLMSFKLKETRVAAATKSMP
jgi:hypothetical protein